MGTKNLKIIGYGKKLFFVALATMVFTLLMSVSSVRAEVTPNWDSSTQTLSITGDGEVTMDIWSVADMPNKSDVKKVEIGNGITSIGQDAFRGCTSLETVTFAAGSKLETIGQGAFYDTALSSITIPASVTSIGQYAFRECTSLETVTFAAGSKLETIGQGAFYKTALSSITIPASVTSIGQDAFSGCTSLETVTFAAGSKLETIGQGAFYKTALSSITIPASVTSIGQNVFFWCTSLETVTFATGSNLETIGKGAFYGTVLGSIKIPASVTSIGQGAFSGCTSLATVTFAAGSNLETIGQDAFSNTKLGSIKIPASVTSIGQNAFRGCTSLATVLVKNELGISNAGIQESAVILRYNTTGEGVNVTTVEGNTNATVVFIPASVTSIGQDAFIHCTSLETVLVQEGVGISNAGIREGASILIYTLDYSGNIVTVLVPSDLTSIPSIVPPTAVILRYNTTEEGVNVTTVEGNTNAKSIFIPASVTSIGQDAFSGCTSLETVLVREGLATSAAGIQSTALILIYTSDYSGNIGTVLVPSDLQTIPSIVPPTAVILRYNTTGEGVNVTTVEGNTNAIVVFIPASVTSIGQDAFSGCTSLETVLVREGLATSAAGIQSTALILIYTSDYSGNIGTVLVPSDLQTIPSIVPPTAVILRYNTTEEGVNVTTVEGNTNATGVLIPASVTSIEQDAFSGCTSLATVLVKNGLDTSNAGIRDAAVTLRYNTTGRDVNVIGVDDTEVTSVFIPTSVSSIDKQAFSGWTSLDTVMLQKKYNVIDNNNHFAGSAKSVVLLYYTEQTGSSGSSSGTSSGISTGTSSGLSTDGWILVSIAGDCKGEAPIQGVAAGVRKTIIVPVGFFAKVTGATTFATCEFANIYIPSSVGNIPESLPASTIEIFQYRNVTFYVNSDDPNASITMPEDFYYGKIPKCIFTTPKGKTLLSWNSKSGGDGTSYALDGTIETPKPNLKLYAQWENVYNKVTINPCEGIDQLIVVANNDTGGGYQINSGEVVLKDTTLRVYAKTKDGYELEDLWYEMDDDEQYQKYSLIDEPICNVEQNITISATTQAKQCTLTLRVDPAEEGLMSHVYMDGKNKVKDNFAYGTKVQVKADTSVPENNPTYTFIGWFSKNGVMVPNSASGSITLTMYSDALYEARYKDSSKKIVKFIANGKVKSVAEVEESLTVDFNLPVATRLQGFEFNAWKLGENEYTVDEKADLITAINEAFGDGVQEVTVTASYNPIKEQQDTSSGYDGKLTVTVKKQVQDDIIDIPSAPELLSESKWISVEAPDDVEGATFSHWELDGVEISRNRTAKFRVIKDCTLTAVYEADTTSSFVLKKATLDGSDLHLEAELTGVDIGSVESVVFKYGADTPLNNSVSCAVDPDSKGTYVVDIPSLNIGTDYYIQPVATLSNNSQITGRVIKVEPESGYDRDEKACATIIECSANDNGGATFVALISPPDGATIVKAGVVVSKKEETSPLNLTDRQYDMESFKASNTQQPWNYTLTTSTTAKTHVRPYVIYTPAGSTQPKTLLGRRAVYP